MKILSQFNKGKNAMFWFIPKKAWRLFLFFGLVTGLFFLLFGQSQAGSVNELRDSLQRELDQIQQQINEYRTQIQETQTQAKTLKREIQLLDDKIKQAELQIRETELVLQQTQMAIGQKTDEITKQEEKMNREKNLLGQYLQNIYEQDEESTLEIIFSQKRLSDIFDEINSLDVIQKKTYDTISQIKTIKEDLEGQKDELSQKKDEELELKAIQEVQRSALNKQQLEKKDLLGQTKGQESTFQKLLKKTKADAIAVRNQIYLLEGVGLSMTLEEAYKHAKFASDLTEVRPAFLLAVLKEESKWGTTVGTGNWQHDMAPRDRQIFIDLCDELNFDPNKMPVSRRPSYGWGGAMGPAQFLPSTWALYKNEVARLTGHNPPSPWNIDDSFTAAGLKLAKAGAGQQTADAEWKAAMIYFAGNNWNKSVYSFYGDAVMDLASVIQEQLDVITSG